MKQGTRRSIAGLALLALAWARPLASQPNPLWNEGKIKFMPDHLEAMIPAIETGDPTALRVFLAEGLKAKETGKRTSAREI